LGRFRMFAVAATVVALSVGGGVAYAASGHSTTTTPSTSTPAPSTTPGTTTPNTAPGPGGMKGPCPNMGGSSSSSSGASFVPSGNV
jgi:hypothetical protein